MKLAPTRPRLGVLFTLLLLASVAPSTSLAETELLLHTRPCTWRLGPSKETGNGRVHYSTVREIGRQALLIAARDEVGMATCDATLREQPRTEQPLSLLLTVDSFFKGECRISIYRSGPLGIGEKPSPEQLVWSEEIGMQEAPNKLYPSLVGPCEKLSRTTFPKLLRELGGEPAETQDS